nr:hypothetical protein [Tanacetum cinerariifolium]
MELELEPTQQGSSYEVSKHLLLSDIEDSVMDPGGKSLNPRGDPQSLLGTRMRMKNDFPMEMGIGMGMRLGNGDVNGFMDSSHSNARSNVSQNSVSSDVVVESSVPSGIALNALTEEIVAYEKESDETHAVKIKGNVYDSVDDCVVAYMKYAAEARFVVRRSCQKRLRNGDVKQKYLVCNTKGCHKGIHVEKFKPHITGCKARDVFNLDPRTRKFVLNVFDTIHNHELERKDFKHLSKRERHLIYLEQAFIVKAASVNIGEVTKVPVWVKLHSVPVLTYSDVGLSLIATQIGKPIMLDAFTSLMSIPDEEEVDGNSREVILVEYEWKPPQNDEGFIEVKCRKNKRKKINTKIDGIRFTKLKAKFYREKTSSSINTKVPSPFKSDMNPQLSNNFDVLNTVEEVVGESGDKGVDPIVWSDSQISMLVSLMVIVVHSRRMTRVMRKIAFGHGVKEQRREAMLRMRNSRRRNIHLI